VAPDEPPAPFVHGLEGDSWVSTDSGAVTGVAEVVVTGRTAAGPPPDPAAPLPPRRRRGRVVLALGAAVLVIGGAAAIAVAATSGSSSPARPVVTGGPAAAQHLVETAIAAAEAARTFHYVSTSSAGGVTQTTVGDAAPDRGRQVITIGTHTFSVLVVGTAAYFQGDAATLQAELSLDPAAAQAHAGQWISLAPSDAPYQSVYAAVTTKAALDDTITIAGKSVLSEVTVGRTTVTPVRGLLTPVDQTPTTGTARLEVRSGRPHLPVRFSGSGTVNNQQSVFGVTFGQWGEQVVVEAPAGAVAYSSLQVGGLNPGSGGVVLT